MPVEATPVTNVGVANAAIRLYMRDYVGIVPDTGYINSLLFNVEFSDREIGKAVALTVNLFNVLTPMIGIFSPNMIPEIILTYGAVSHLLLSASVAQLRNQATVQDGDVQPIGIDDKQALYMQQSQYHRQLFDQAAKAYKVQLNLENAYGGLSSGYINTSRSTVG